jgi:hypothetical protein
LGGDDVAPSQKIHCLLIKVEVPGREKACLSDLESIFSIVFMAVAAACRPGHHCVCSAESIWGAMKDKDYAWGPLYFVL